jgi:hypothetical protein
MARRKVIGNAKARVQRMGNLGSPIATQRDITGIPSDFFEFSFVMKS